MHMAKSALVSIEVTACFYVRPMQFRRKAGPKGKFGNFIGFNAYPKCRFTRDE